MADAKEKVGTRWYLKPVSVVIFILAFGPFAIPFVWMSGAFNKWTKIAITVALIVLTVWFIKASGDLYNSLSKDMQLIQEMLKTR